MQCQTCTVAPVSEDEDDGDDKEPAAAAKQLDGNEEAGPFSITPTSSRSSRSRKEKTPSTVDKAIRSMVRQRKENQERKKSVSDVLEVEKNPKKAFVLWFSSRALVIEDHRWKEFKCQAILLLLQFEQDNQPPTRMPPLQMVPPQQMGAPPQQLGAPTQHMDPP